MRLAFGQVLRWSSAKAVATRPLEGLLLLSTAALPAATFVSTFDHV